MACPTNLVPTPPPPTSPAVFPALPSPPAHYSIHCSSVLSRARSIGFKGPPSIQQEIEKSASGYRISVSSYPPPCRAFVRNFVDKTMPASVSPPAIHGPSPSRSGWLRSVQFANFVLSTGCTDIDRTRHCRRGKTRK